MTWQKQGKGRTVIDWKTETYQPNAMCVDLVGILILNVDGCFLRFEEVFRGIELNVLVNFVWWCHCGCVNYVFPSEMISCLGFALAISF